MSDKAEGHQGLRFASLLSLTRIDPGISRFVGIVF